ncbi:MAG: DUF4349 domain-containing protein [Flavobacterium sp.]|nr:MAG: DUF4349 domain-containing protein [Flavobacterium sp.]
MKKTIGAMLLLLAIAGCKNINENSDSAVGEVAAMELPPSPPASADMSRMDNASATPGSVQQKVIKNAEIRFETDDLSATAVKVNAAVAKYRAQVQNDSENKSDYSFNRVMTIRIPAQNFDAFIGEIGKGVSYFDQKVISSQDVTEEYVDIEARLKAKKVLEARYLDLIGKAKKVSEVLEIEKELSAIREDIEAQEGRLRYMQSRVALSTINLEFYKKTALEPGATVSYGSKMGNAIKSGFNGLSSFFIGILYVWPFILIFVIVLFLFRKKLRKRK